MRAKRSKKYRRLMSAYTLSFSFHPPYQVLLDSTFLKQCHRFHMPVRQFLSNTLQGDVRPMVTECTLAQIMGNTPMAARERDEEGTDRRIRQIPVVRPEYLPPPTEVPLRYCKHETQKKDMGTKWTEADCLVDLLGGSARGGEQAKNKWHYVLATADGEGLESHEQAKRPIQKRPDVRERARQIPGVPIVYVKRSVMILEEMSGASERAIRGKEKEKLREGILGKRKRGLGGDESVDEGALGDAVGPGDVTQKTPRGLRKAKGPNPLSMLKKKAKAPQNGVHENIMEQESGSSAKSRRRRKHISKKVEGSETTADAVAV